LRLLRGVPRRVVEPEARNLQSLRTLRGQHHIAARYKFMEKACRSGMHRECPIAALAHCNAATGRGRRADRCARNFQTAYIFLNYFT